MANKKKNKNQSTKQTNTKTNNKSTTRLPKSTVTDPYKLSQQVCDLPKTDAEQKSTIKTARKLMLLSALFSACFAVSLFLNIFKITTVHWVFIVVSIIACIGCFLAALLVVGHQLTASGQLDINNIKAEETKKTIDKLNSNPVFAKYSKPTVQKSFKPNNKK
jgi:hypothetical protein